jgi:hypothetical protein
VYSVFSSSSSTRRRRRARRWCDLRLPFGASRNATAVAIACGKWTRSRDPSIATRIAGANKAEEHFFVNRKTAATPRKNCVDQELDLQNRKAVLATGERITICSAESTDLKL